MKISLYILLITTYRRKALCILASWLCLWSVSSFRVAVMFSRECSVYLLVGKLWKFLSLKRTVCKLIGCFPIAEPPVFIEVPKDLQTSVNRTAMFNCKASIGSQITWFKRMKGSSSLSSVQKLGQRFNVFPNGSLKIHPVQKIDEAFYRCLAENPVGYNNASAFLRVLGMYDFRPVLGWLGSL